MSTLSPRVGLTLMSDSDFINPSVIDTNATKLDQITSVTQCTSSTRPSSPFEGQHIYETDKQNLRRYDAASASWYLLGSGPNGSAAQGLIGSFSSTAAALIAGTMTGTSNPNNFSVASMMDYNVPVLANRTYKIIEQGWFTVTGTLSGLYYSTTQPELYTLYNLGSQPGLSGTSALEYVRCSYNSKEFGKRVPIYKVMSYTPNSSGTLYLRSCIRVNTNNYDPANSVGRPADTVGSYAWVYDMGPNGSSY